MYKITKFRKVSMTLAALVVGMVLVPSVALAAVCTTNNDCVYPEACNGAKKDATTGALTKDSGTCGKNQDMYGLNPIKDTGLGKTPLLQTASRIINVALSMLGLIAVVIVLAGGFKWMTAGGNEEKTTEARKMIFSGIIGLAIILSAWAITLFVFNQLAQATGSGSVPSDLIVQ